MAKFKVPFHKLPDIRKKMELLDWTTSQEVDVVTKYKGREIARTTVSCTDREVVFFACVFQLGWWVGGHFEITDLEIHLEELPLQK